MIAIIGVLIGLLLPAVQSARESSRRTNCSNNLKQIGLAINTFESAKKSFPAGFSCFLNRPGPCWGWAAFVLPFMEQNALYDQLGVATRPLDTVYKVGAAATDRALLQTRIPGYRCPSDTTKGLNDLMRFGSTEFFQIATSNFVGCAGNQPEPEYATAFNRDKTINDVDTGGVFFGVADARSNPPGRGPLGLNRRRVTDGTSKTIAVGERGSFNYSATWAGNGQSDSHDQNANARTIGRPSFLINRNASSEGKPEDQGKGYGSSHPGGAQFVFLDGGVSFVSENLDSTRMKYLTHRNDGANFTVR